MTAHGVFLVRGYSGHGEGLNNGLFQYVHNVGPIPVGLYSVGPPVLHPGLGPVVLQLKAHPYTETKGRSGFYIHGDNAKGDQSASEGCIVIGRAERQSVASGGFRWLAVVP